jgi:hypothetical protein
MWQQVKEHKGTIPFYLFVSHRGAMCIHVVREGRDRSNIGHCHETMGNLNLSSDVHVPHLLRGTDAVQSRLLSICHNQ